MVRGSFSGRAFFTALPLSPSLFLPLENRPLPFVYGGPAALLNRIHITIVIYPPPVQPRTEQPHLPVPSLNQENNEPNKHLHNGSDLTTRHETGAFEGRCGAAWLGPLVGGYLFEKPPNQLSLSVYEELMRWVFDSVDQHHLPTRFSATPNIISDIWR